MEAIQLKIKEQERIDAVEKLDKCFTYNLQEFEDLVDIIQSYFNVESIFLSVIGKNNQRFVVKKNIPFESLSNSQSPCYQQIHSDSFYTEFKEKTTVYSEFNIKYLLSLKIVDAKTNLPIGTLGLGHSSDLHFSEVQVNILKKFKSQIEKIIYNRLQFDNLIEAKVQFKKSEVKKEKLLECSKLGSWEWWLIENRINFDSRWAALVGVEYDSLHNNLSDWSSRVHPEDKERVLSDIKNYLEGRTEFYENIHRLRHSNGDWIWTLDRGVIFERDENRKPIRFLGTQFDITKYINNDFFSSEIQKAAHIGGWQFDFVQQKFKLTDQVFEILDLPISQDLMSLEDFLNYFSEDDRKKLFTLMLKNQDCKSFNSILSITTQAGARKVVEIISHPVENSFQFVSKAIGIIHDITDKFEAEKAIEESRIKATMAAKLASLGELSAGVAHEINNPLAILMGTVSSLEQAANDKDKFKHKVEILNKAIHRIAKIVKGLSKFSRTSEHLEMRPENLKEIVSESLIMTEIRAKKKDVSIRFNPDSESLIFCNPLEIEQVVINLVNNAIDAVQNIDSEKWVEIKLFNRSDKTVLQVIDAGHGIDPVISEKLFNPFYTTKPLGEGTGLGLSICKGIVESHKGEISVNHACANTCFEVVFPVVNTALKTA